jgi:hypothetical protein
VLRAQNVAFVVWDLTTAHRPIAREHDWLHENRQANNQISQYPRRPERASACLSAFLEEMGSWHRRPWFELPRAASSALLLVVERRDGL